MLSIQAYCVHNQDVIKLESINTQSSTATESDLASLSELVVLVGPQRLLDGVLDTNNENKTLVYIPDNLNDQLNLHELLTLDQQQSLTCLINTEMYCDANKQRSLTALIRAVDLAIAQDSEFFHWIESNIDALIEHQADALSQLVMHYSSIAATDAVSLLENDQQTVATLREIAGNQCSEADARAMIIATKTHWSVLREQLPEGADARVWHLLRAFGYNLCFDALADQANPLAKQLFNPAQITLLRAIGELIVIDELSINSESAHDETARNNELVVQLEAALLWLDEMNGMQNN